jgi:gluconate 2-dehydrogenase gamma chain
MNPDDLNQQDDNVTISRRTLVTSAIAFVPLAALTVSAQTPAAAPAKALDAGQRRILEAVVDRVIPKDELGPGAVEGGAAEYIDRCLADYLASEKASITDGLAYTDAYARAAHGGAFTELSPEKRDEILTAMEANTVAGFPTARAFFNRVRRLTLEGMFGDPHYGGNTNFAGWDLIKYPGPRPATSPEDQKMGVEIKPYRRSAWGVDHNGH